MIHEANHALQDVCKGQKFVFIDNDSLSLKDGKLNVSLYKDPVNLNKKNRKFLG